MANCKSCHTPDGLGSCDNNAYYDTNIISCDNNADYDTNIISCNQHCCHSW